MTAVLFDYSCGTAALLEEGCVSISFFSPQKSPECPAPEIRQGPATGLAKFKTKHHLKVKGLRGKGESVTFAL